MLILNGLLACYACWSCLIAVLQFSTFLSTQNKNTSLNSKCDMNPFWQSEEIRSSLEINQDPTVIEVVGEILWNVAVASLFLIQHSVMASQWWKSLLSDIGIVTSQRAIYVIATSLVLQLIMKHVCVVHLPAVWYLDTTDHLLYCLLPLLLHVLAWLVLYATCIIMDVPEMVGIRQVYYQYLECDPPLMQKSAATRRLYAHMRHGGATCLFIILWLHPMMTTTRVVVATTLTLYLMYGYTVTDQDYVYLREQIGRKRITLRAQRTKSIELLQ